VPVKFTNNAQQFVGDLDKARRNGVIACGSLLVRRLKKAFGSGYYKGGAFRDTLKVKASIQREDAPTLGRRGYEIRVGPRFGKPQQVAGVKRSKKSKPWLAPLAWELGHPNLFTGKYERVEIFRPTGVQSVPALRAEYAKTVTRYLARWKA
jgi:hypothetical protein